LLVASCPGILYGVKGDIYVDDLVIITGSLDGVVRSFDKVTGKCLWESQLRGRIYATPRVSTVRGVVVVLVGTTRGILYELDYRTGLPLHETLVSERILNDPLVDGESGRLYLITEGSHVYVLDDATQ
jgi:outer membrane protein assembly factor BamB